MKLSKTDEHHFDSCGTTNVGERGQIVIPKKIREKYKLTKGTSVLVMDKSGAIVIIPTDKLKNMLTHITEELAKLK
jgi:AbrB family looped-hinge helix DNA binding protein